MLQNYIFCNIHLDYQSYLILNAQPIWGDNMSTKTILSLCNGENNFMEQPISKNSKYKKHPAKRVFLEYELQKLVDGSTFAIIEKAMEEHSIISSVNGVSSLKGHSFTLGLSHLYVLNSFLQTGEYPDFPVLLLVQLFVYKSVLPLNASIKIFTFSSLEITLFSLGDSFSSTF